MCHLVTSGGDTNDGPTLAFTCQLMQTSCHVARVAHVAHVAHVGLMQEPCQLWSLPQTATEVNTCKARANFGKHDMNFTHVARV